MKFALPIVVLLALVGLFAVGLQKDPRLVPSPLINKPAPMFSLPNLADPGFKTTPQQWQGRTVLVNFFASWCAGCQVEHPLMMQLAEQGVEIVGIAYKDDALDSQRWLSRHGNPYRTVLMDVNGQVGIDWGVYGVPESFVVDGKGLILYKQIGPLTEADWQAKVRPLMEQKS
jgi:cytochrome c biogenesis protein CcmG/thiol:disulfide interchange protein DsbE